MNATRTAKNLLEDSPYGWDEHVDEGLGGPTKPEKVPPRMPLSRHSYPCGRKLGNTRTGSPTLVGVPVTSCKAGMGQTAPSDMGERLG